MEIMVGLPLLIIQYIPTKNIHPHNNFSNWVKKRVVPSTFIIATAEALN